jgi:hypothetical protein
LGSRQPTNRTNFCGADKLPLSPRCCDIAPANPYPFCFQRILFFAPRLERALTPGQVLNDRLSGFAGRGFSANIDGATAHDCHPLLKLGHNAQPPGMVAGRPAESAAAMRRFTESELRRRRFFTRE